MAKAENQAKTGTRFSKKVNLRAPYITWEQGLAVCGVIGRKFEEPSKFGVKQVVEVTLIDPISQTVKGKEVRHPAGAVVRVNVKAGCLAYYTLPEGTKARLECVGKVPSSNGGNDAWSFELETEDESGN